MTIKSALRVVQPLVVLTAVALLVFAAWEQWDAVRGALSSLNWPLAVAALAILAAAQPLMGAISWIVLRNLRQFFPYLKITSLYFVSQAAKYLPGGIWAFPGRVIIYQAIGVPPAESMISLVQEVAALFLGAALVGLGGLLAGLQAEYWMHIALWVGMSACILGVMAVQHPRVWRLFSRLSLGKAATGIEIAPRFSPFWLAKALLPALLFWTAAAIGFHWLAIAAVPEAVKIPPLQAAGIFALAWCAGFVVVVAPAGLGVREAALVALLSAYIQPGAALGVALAARLWWTVAEALFILPSVAYQSGSLGGRGAASQQPGEEIRD